ncbi:MAG: UvrD-helicase domain-containing protein, partial [Dactylosporangium sp.]|nr:UvrD-helicase domain-containing protein [Dactylosporangium sp.]NNJ63811.1 UvrD-helicase domain-containing protein [Dactylosporangium sp.]
MRSGISSRPTRRGPRTGRVPGVAPPWSDIAVTSGVTTGPDAIRRSYRLIRASGEPEAPRVPDDLQRAVIAHTAGPLLVIGGPGTGKTTTLVRSVLARIAEGVDPEGILVLTFGRRGVARLRDRIESRLTTTGQPQLRTFHGYAFGLLRRAAVAAGDEPPRLLTGPEQDLVIRELLAGWEPAVLGWPASLHPALRTRAFAQELRDLLLRCAERGIGPAGLDGMARAHQRPDWAAAARFFREYLQVLTLRETGDRAGAGYDYAELVQAATRLLRRDEALLAAERRRLSCVYVDELADTDPAQIELLATVAGAGAHLVAFADPDASTFAFRGADPEIVTSFQDGFPRTPSDQPAARITLATAYRSTSPLLEATRRVAARLRGPARH